MKFLLAVAPGLLFLIEAALVLAVLRRLGEPVPRKVAALGFGLVLLLLGPVLLGGRVLLPLDLLATAPPFQDLPRTERPANPLQRDLVVQVTPALAEVRGAWRRGEWPLWSATSGAGASLLGKPAAQVLQPLQLAGLALPLARSAGLVAALKVWLAFLFTFLFLRRLTLGISSASFGALTFAASSFVVQWLGWPAATAAVCLPALLLTIDRAATPERHRSDLVALAVAVFALATAGDDDTGRAVCFVVGAFAVLRLAELPRPRRVATLTALGAAVALGLALAAPVLLARTEFTATSATQARLDAFREQRDRDDPLGLWSFDSAQERESWRDGLAHRLLPSLAVGAFGDDRAGAYWGAANVNEDTGGFAGTAALTLALLSIALPGRGPRSREARFFALMLATSALLVARPPLLVEVADAFDSASLHRHGLVVVAFALASLGALALERVRRERLTRPLAAIGVSLALGALLAWVHFGYPPPTPQAAALTVLRDRCFALQLGTLAVVTGLLLSARRRPGALDLVPWVAACELLLLGLPVNRSGLAGQYFPTPPTLGFLVAETAPGQRILGLENALPPATGAIYGLADVRLIGTDNPDAYTRLIAPVTPPRRGLSDLIRRPNHPILDLLGVRFVLAPPGTPTPPEQIIAFQDPSGVVFERASALPPLFLPTATEVYDPSAGPWEAWIRSNPDFAAKTLVRRSPEATTAWRARRPARATAEVRALTPTRVTGRIETGEPRLVASSIFGDRGWRALIGGRATATTLANGPLLALWVPDGRHDVEFLYRPSALVGGLALAALGLALGGAWLAAPRERLQ